MIYVTKAEYRADYEIWVEFNNGISGIADLADLLWGPVFEPLQNQDDFRKFTVSDVFRTIVWENGADLAPEALYTKVLAGNPS